MTFVIIALITLFLGWWIIKKAMRMAFRIVLGIIFIVIVWAILKGTYQL